MAEPIPQLFGVIPTGAPCIITPSAAPSQTSFVYTLPTIKPFSHIVIFLLPGITLPPDTAAAAYISAPSIPSAGTLSPSFKFLGAIGPGKESAVFKVSGLTTTTQNGGIAEVDMDADDSSPSGVDITLGISLETVEAVAAQMASLQSSQPSNPSSNIGSSAASQALVVANKTTGVGKPDTLVLAQRIIKNAFNFLASFSGNVNGGVEVVPLKAFEDWWRKFEGRVRNDPGFLE
ncbi:hypothetical protein JHW43_005701 [Diplocarpon mali]|nr:hypothetical protein JHW43_005701 [Diplocarpon mali]